MPVPIYLEWEIKFNEQYLKGSLAQFVPFALFWDICVKNKVKVTVNQLRSLAAGKPHPHPDHRLVAAGLIPKSRGDMFVFEDDPGELPTDNDIPKEIAAFYAQKMIEKLGNADLVQGRESGGMSLEEIRKAFSELFELAEK